MLTPRVPHDTMASVIARLKKAAQAKHTRPTALPSAPARSDTPTLAVGPAKTVAGSKRRKSVSFNPEVSCVDSGHGDCPTEVIDVANTLDTPLPDLPNGYFDPSHCICDSLTSTITEAADEAALKSGDEENAQSATLNHPQPAGYQPQSSYKKVIIIGTAVFVLVVAAGACILMSPMAMAVITAKAIAVKAAIIAHPLVSTAVAGGAVAVGAYFGYKKFSANKPEPEDKDNSDRDELRPGIL